MRSKPLACLLGSLVSIGSLASAQDLGDGTGYFQGAASSVVTGDGTGYFRGVTPSAPPPPRAPVAYPSPAFMSYDSQAYWPFVLPRWNWLASTLMGSRLFPYGYGTPPAPTFGMPYGMPYGMRRFLDLPMHRRSAR